MDGVYAIDWGVLHVAWVVTMCSGNARSSDVALWWMARLDVSMVESDTQPFYCRNNRSSVCVCLSVCMYACLSLSLCVD